MQKHVNLVDLVKSLPTHILLQDLASIQTRKSLSKFVNVSHNYPAQRFNFHIGTTPASAPAAVTPEAVRARKDAWRLAHRTAEDRGGGSKRRERGSKNVSKQDSKQDSKRRERGSKNVRDSKQDRVQAPSIANSTAQLEIPSMSKIMQESGHVLASWTNEDKKPWVAFVYNACSDLFERFVGGSFRLRVVFRDEEQATRVWNRMSAGPGGTAVGNIRRSPKSPPHVAESGRLFGLAELLANPAIGAQIFAGSIQTPHGLINFN